MTGSETVNDLDGADLYGGLAGASLAIDVCDLGHGVALRTTFAHIMAPYLAAFAPASPGEPHPAPWKAVSGGIGFDVLIELAVPRDFALPKWFDRLNTIWWITALLRLRATPLIRVPVIASLPFSQIATAKEEPRFWSIEMEPSQLAPVRPQPASAISEADLVWIKTHWIPGGRLMRESTAFSLAVQALDRVAWTRSASLALVSLWGALESLFLPSQAELSFRASATIAAFLEPAGAGRLECFKRTKRLYDSRSKAAHGTPLDDPAPLYDTYALVRRIVMKMIEQGSVPTQKQLEAQIFS